MTEEKTETKAEEAKEESQLPDPPFPMIDIRTKLEDLGAAVEDLVLGDFDAIGEYTAKKARQRNQELYAKTGCFFRPNYERGMLAYAMVKRYKPKKILEIGFGRGYWSVCAAKAFFDLDIEGSILSIDANFDPNHLNQMSKLFPEGWLSKIKMMKGRSMDLLPKIEEEFDLIYIDGDHTYQGVKTDWEMIKDKFKGFVIFDDYHLPDHKDQPDIQVARAVDEIGDEYTKEMIVMDRLIFIDDRDEHRDKPKRYGQVIVRHPDFEDPKDDYVYDW